MLCLSFAHLTFYRFHWLANQSCPNLLIKWTNPNIRLSNCKLFTDMRMQKQPQAPILLWINELLFDMNLLWNFLCTSLVNFYTPYPVRWNWENKKRFISYYFWNWHDLDPFDIRRACTLSELLWYSQSVWPGGYQVTSSWGGVVVSGVLLGHWASNF